MEKYEHIYFDTQTYETVCIINENKSERFKGKPSKVIHQWCLQHGSSLEGRIDSFRYLVKAKQKPSILVCEKECLLYIPTTSIQSLECEFIRFDCIEKIQRSGNRQCKVVTKRGFIYTFDVDVRVLKQQYQRAFLFLLKLHLIDVNYLKFKG